MSELRRDERFRVYQIEIINVYEDTEPAEVSIDLENLNKVYTAFIYITATMVNISKSGLKLQIDGHNLMSKNTLKVGKSYILELVLSTLPKDIKLPLSKKDANYYYVPMKGIARWINRNTNKGISSVGFEISKNNPDVINEFFQKHFKIDK